MRWSAGDSTASQDSAFDRVADAAGSDPEILRLENYDTEIPPNPDAVEATRAAIGRDDANSCTFRSQGSTR